MAAKQSKFQQKLDAFSRALFLDEHGKPKSAVLLYSFLLSILFAGIYAAAYFFLLEPLESALSSAPVAFRNVVQYLVPAIAGSVPCVALYFAFSKNKQTVPCTFLWMAALLILMMLVMLILADWSDGGTDYLLFLVILVVPSALSILCGGIPSWLLYRKELKKQKELEKIAKSRPSYYNT